MVQFQDHPLVNFRFEVSLNPPDGTFYFSKVSGIEKSLETIDLPEGGNNNYSHKLPVKTKNEELKLHRGVLPTGSTLLTWCENTISGNFDIAIVPKTVLVKLLDESGSALITWQFNNAFPTRIRVNEFDAQSQAILIEEISFTYSEFTRTYT
jgi:phage tail-like protein